MSDEISRIHMEGKLILVGASYGASMSHPALWTSHGRQNWNTQNNWLYAYFLKWENEYRYHYFDAASFFEKPWEYSAAMEQLSISSVHELWASWESVRKEHICAIRNCQECIKVTELQKQHFCQSSRRLQNSERNITILTLCVNYSLALVMRFWGLSVFFSSSPFLHV